MYSRSVRPLQLLVSAGFCAFALSVVDANGREQTPPTPKWLCDITRVAYTDLPNRTAHQDWPDKVIPDLAKAGVQLLFSRCHSGESWDGLGWHSKFGDPDPRMLGTPANWEALGGLPFDGDAHSGKRCLRLIHTQGMKQTLMNRAWKYRSGKQGSMLDVLEGKVTFWYKAVRATNAKLWLGAVPMSKDALENTGSSRSGIEIPAEHVGDGKWHEVTVNYDYTGNPKVKWLHTSCFITGDAAELLIDDVELIGVTPQPITNSGFEEVEGARDGTRHVNELCRKHGIRYLPYYWAQREPKSVGDAHPEWKCINNHGKPTQYYCTNNPDYRALVRNRIVELVRDVGVDGIFFDMFHARGHECYCECCRAQFQALAGEEPPLEEDFDDLLWQEWVTFKYRSLENAMLDFNKAIKAVNPDAALVVNTWNAWVYENKHNIRNSIRVVEVVDALLEETGWYDVVDPSFFAFPARHNFMNWHLAGLCKKKRAFMWGASSLPGWRQLTQLEARIRAMTMMTNGAVPALSAPGRRTVKSYISDIAQRDTFFRGDGLYPWCGLVVSEKTELWYGRNETKERYVKGVYGAFQAMLERHLPMSLVTDRELELDQLEDYRVLFMPNCAALSDREMATVRKFVANGGGLVATYETSRYDEHAKPRETFGLVDLLKAKEVGTFDSRKMRSGWNPMAMHIANLHMAETHRWGNDPVIGRTLATKGVTTPVGTIGRRIPLHCRMLLTEPDGVPLSPIRVTTAHYDRKAKTMERTDNVAIIESTYGKGKVIYFPFDISWSFFRYGHEYLARMMELALRETAAAPPPVEVHAPTIVQAMTHVQGKRLVVHLLNDISSTGRSQNAQSRSLYLRREIIPIHDVHVTFRDTSLKRFRLIPGETPLVATAVEDGLRVTVPKLEIHCMVVAE